MRCLSFSVVLLFALAGAQATAILPHARILGGENASPKSYQFFLASSSPTKHDFGAASLITYHHAITSGKLVAGFQKWVLAYGSIKLGPQSKMVESRVGFLHPGYDVTTNEHDLGIILLPSSLLKDVLKPIALPMSSVNVPRSNEEGQVSGFGIVEDLAKPAPNEELKTTYLTVVKDGECPISNFAAQENSNFCARDIFFNTRLCRGDVGSAFVVLQRGVPTLAGITSQVSPKCLAGNGHDASSFVRIQNYLGWIKALTGIE